MTREMVVRCLLGAFLFLWLLPARAGGGGVIQTDRCVVQMGFMKAHLTLYQPQTQASEKFCDAVPDTGETVFVLSYLHDSLNRVPIEFRVIRNVTGMGRFAEWRDVAAIEDLEGATVFHQAPVTRPAGSYTVEHRFREEGDYLLLVTAGHPTKDEAFHAVMPLTVGGTPWLLWTGIGFGAAGALGVFAWRMRRRQARVT